MPLCFYSILGDVIHASRYRRSSCVGRLSTQGVWKGQDWMYATRPLCMLMEKDSALPTASTQMQERPWPDATRLAETGKVAILNGCGGVTCNRDTSPTLARSQEAES